MARTAAELRTLVDGLRPPALDHGLVPALRVEAGRFTAADGLVVTVVADDVLDGLPAAVEAAAFRIVVEAMTNTVHHASARTCSVRVRRGHDLQIEVLDDGIGPAGTTDGAGVGLSSMRERAAELGGTCIVSAAVPVGTRVHARLPLGGRCTAARPPRPGATAGRGTGLAG